MIKRCFMDGGVTEGCISSPSAIAAVKYDTKMRTQNYRARERKPFLKVVATLMVMLPILAVLPVLSWEAENKSIQGEANANSDGTLGVLFKPLWETSADDWMQKPVDS